MRGEDKQHWKQKTPKTGSPPHARGRRASPEFVGDAVRITPACAGKTHETGAPLEKPPDHPRMRGEDLTLR